MLVHNLLTNYVVVLSTRAGLVLHIFSVAAHSTQLRPPDWLRTLTDVTDWLAQPCTNWEWRIAVALIDRERWWLSGPGDQWEGGGGALWGLQVSQKGVWATRGVCRLQTGEFSNLEKCKLQDVVTAVLPHHHHHQGLGLHPPPPPPQWHQPNNTISTTSNCSLAAL